MSRSNRDGSAHERQAYTTSNNPTHSSRRMGRINPATRHPAPASAARIEIRAEVSPRAWSFGFGRRRISTAKSVVSENRMIPCCDEKRRSACNPIQSTRSAAAVAATIRLSIEEPRLPFIRPKSLLCDCAGNKGKRHMGQLGFELDRRKGRGYVALPCRCIPATRKG